ncbi:unnamed protein product [Brassicogethes aeneus]|uniref:Transmembrane protein 164 n=1 Tax=Brassicogethes aeneus TaxID=1431903 RepID=A0A9P0FKJ9_BRAAE|nr:unnamed protein product [Brassicogethes aeneus]
MEWAYSGVNKTVSRNAGTECEQYLNPFWRYAETIVVLLLAVALFNWSYYKVTLPEVKIVRNEGTGKRNLLILMSLIWGMEIGYKLSSRTVIYLLNPCHVTTAIQLNLLNGPLLAYLFPETDTRIMMLENGIYWIQHGLMFIVPYYLLRLGGTYNIEPLSDISWNALSYSINLIYHFAVLQAIAIPTEVNLNHMLCPAILDPFQGQLYRVCAVIHQAFLCPVLCKLYCCLSEFFITEFSLTKVKTSPNCKTLPYRNAITETKGHQHSD